MLSQEAGQAAAERRNLGAWARRILELSGTFASFRSFDRFLRWPHRLEGGKEMPLRLRLIKFGADVVAGGQSSGGGEAGSGCLGEADFGAAGHPPWLEGPRQMGTEVPSP